MEEVGFGVVGLVVALGDRLVLGDEMGDYAVCFRQLQRHKHLQFLTNLTNTY